MTDRSLTYKDAGMIAVVHPSNVAAFTATLKTPWYQIGKIVPGEPRVTYRA